MSVDALARSIAGQAEQTAAQSRSSYLAQIISLDPLEVELTSSRQVLGEDDGLVVAQHVQEVIDGLDEDDAVLVEHVDGEWVVQAVLTDKSVGVLPADPALEQIRSLVLREPTDSRGETLAFGVRRAYQWRRSLSSTRIIGDTRGAELWSDLELVPEDDTGPERINATSGGLSLALLARLAMAPVGPASQEARQNAARFADMLLPLQWSNPEMLNYGGFMAGPDSNTASSLGTGIMGLGLLEVWRATGEPRYFMAARRAADFCLRLADPNAYWFPKYGVNPINRTVGGVTWYGFCDEVTAGDKISTTSTVWNLKAAELCLQMYMITGDAAYETAALQARDFMAYGALEGWDYFAVSTNVDATYVSEVWVSNGSHAYNDHVWHHAGDHVATGTSGTDQPEYGLPALLNLGFPEAPVLTAYDRYMGFPINDPSTPFGQVFDPRICWTGFLRMNNDPWPRFYGDYYDVQGNGCLLGLKAKHRPAHYALSRPMATTVALKGGIQDGNQDAIWSTMGTFKFATQGSIVVAMAGLGLLNAYEGRV